MLDTIDAKQIYGVRLMTTTEPQSGLPRLPQGYASWLEYAIDCMDMSSLKIESLFSDNDSTFDREAVRLAARKELDDLRNKAATLDKLLAGSPNKPTTPL